jgi:hypothetical protein
MGLNLRRALAASLLVGVLAACSMDRPSYPSYRGEGGNVKSIEMAWADGSGMGAFVDSTGAGQPASAAVSASTLNYRVRVVFDTGFSTTVVQDASVPLAVGERVWIQGGKVVPHESAEADPKRNLAPF